MPAFIAPMPKAKPVHKAKHIGPNGEISPLCAKKPKALNIKVAGWTNRDEAVTCPKCLALLKK